MSFTRFCWIGLFFFITLAGCNPSNLRILTATKLETTLNGPSYMGFTPSCPSTRPSLPIVSPDQILVGQFEFDALPICETTLYSYEGTAWFDLAVLKQMPITKATLHFLQQASGTSYIYSYCTAHLDFISTGTPLVEPSLSIGTDTTINFDITTPIRDAIAQHFTTIGFHLSSNSGCLSSFTTFSLAVTS